MEDDQNLAFIIQPIGKLDVDGVRLILNHTETSSEYDDDYENNEDTTAIQYNNREELNDNNDNESNEEDDDNDNDDEYSDANSGENNIKKASSVSNTLSPSSPSEEEDWLSKMSMDITSDGQMMVIGGGGNGAIGTGLALILQRKLNDPSWRTTITLDHQTQNGTDRITSIQFVPINLHLINYVIAVGYTSGYLRVFSIQGNLLLSQLFYNKPILKIKVKNTSTLPIGDILVQQKYVVHELTLVYPDNIVVNISGVTFMSIVQVCFNQRNGGGDGNNNNNNLSFKKWTLGNSVDKVNDVSFCGPFLGSPFRALPYSTTEQSMVRLVAVGNNPMISFYYPTEDGGSTFSVMISSITSRLTTAVFSYAKNWWGGGSSSSQQSSQQTQSSQQQKQPHQEKPVPLSLRWAIADFKREIISINNDPSGRYAISTDNLGRVLLIDLVNSLVVKMWKGYRDCQCGFISVVENIGGSNENHSGSKDTNSSDKEESFEDLEDFIPRKLLKKTNSNTIQSRTYLVIYLGRRGILEVWGLKHRSREYFKTIGRGCKLLSTTTPSVFQNLQQQQTPNLRNSGSVGVSSINNINQEQYNKSEGQSHCFIIHTDGSIKEIKYNNGF